MKGLQSNLKGEIRCGDKRNRPRNGSQLARRKQEHLAVLLPVQAFGGLHEDGASRPRREPFPGGREVVRGLREPAVRLRGLHEPSPRVDLRRGDR